MSLANLHTLQDSANDPNSEFKLLRYKILSEFEGNIPTPYFDSKGIITIGIGFNIDLLANRNLVIGAQGMGLSPAQQAAIEAAWSSSTMDEIRALPQSTKTQLWAKNAELCAYLDSILGTGLTFSMSDPQIKTVFDKLVLDHQDAISSLISTPSLEQIALISLDYNGMVGPGLRTALAMSDSNDARAEAWYQIRYKHVAGQSEARRYAEAALFGLYGQGQSMTDDEARAVYRMYTKHNSSGELTNHDSKYFSKAATTANDWLSKAGVSGASVEDFSLAAQAPTEPFY